MIDKHKKKNKSVNDIPRWVKQLNRNSSTIWNFGIVSMGTMTVIIYLSDK